MKIFPNRQKGIAFKHTLFPELQTDKVKREKTWNARHSSKAVKPSGSRKNTPKRI